MRLFRKNRFLLLRFFVRRHLRGFNEKDDRAQDLSRDRIRGARLQFHAVREDLKGERLTFSLESLGQCFQRGFKRLVLF